MSDAYKIGITVALTNVVSAELLKIISQFGSADKAALGFAGKLGLVAGAVAIVGTALAAGVEEARKFQIETAKFSLFGMSDRVNADAKKFAENMNIIGTSATEAMHLMVEAQGVFRESGLSDDQALVGAKLAAPMLAKIDFIGKTLDGDSASKMHTSAQAMLRFIDMQGGLNDPVKFNAIANAGFKAIQSSGGNINWEQYRQFRSRAMNAAVNMSDEALFGEFEPLLQEFKGSTAGFALRTAYNRLNGIIKVPNQVAHELIAMGVWDKNQIEFNSMGGIRSFKGNPLSPDKASLLASDPARFYEKYIKPSYDAQHLTPDAIARNNAMIFGSTGGGLYTAIDRQWATLQRSDDSWKKAKGIDDSVEVARNTIDGQLVEVTAQWHTLMKNLGEDILPAVNVGLKGLVYVLEGLNWIFGWKRDSNASVAQHNSASSSLDWWKGKLGLGSGSAVPPPQAKEPIVIDHKTMLDGRVIANSVTEYQVQGLATVPSAGTGFDGRMALLPVN